MVDEKTIEIVVVHGNPLRGDCLTRTLAAELQVAVLGMKTVDDLASAGTANAALAILDMGPRSLQDLRAVGDIERVRTFFPDISIAVILDRIDAAQALQARSLGLTGFVSSAEKLDIVVAAVRLILAGGKYYSNAAELTVAGDWAPRLAPDDSFAREGDDKSPCYMDAVVAASEEWAPAFVPSFRFTSREAQVLECLQQGLPNKSIANKLRLSENTVKVHLRRIMRKLHVTNRTEAALSGRMRPPISAAAGDEPLSSLSGSGQALFQFRKDVP